MSKPNFPTFRDLKSSFETRSTPTTATSPETYRSGAGDLANMSTTKPTRTVPAIAQTIDSVLDTPAAKQALRPIAKLRPSWIGPPRPTTPSAAAAMKQHVNIEYTSPGLKPPVYIFTSLSDPQWEAVEMLAEKEGTEYSFSKAFDVDEGEYQYKFRLGPGDWWTCDETRPTVDDGTGNKNNLLVVKAHYFNPSWPVDERKDSKTSSPEPSKPAALPTTESHPQPQIVVASALHESSALTPQPAVERKDGKSPASPVDPKPPAALTTEPHSQSQAVGTPKHDISFPAPLLKHEDFIPNQGSESQQTPEREVKDPLADEALPDDIDAPLMKHEAFASTADDDSESSDDGSSTSSDSEDESTKSPLMRHESVTPYSTEQEHAPLFRHESIALGYNHHEHPVSTINPVKTPQKAGSRSSSPIEKFPTDHAGILEKIHRASIAMAEDETLDHSGLHSPHSQALSESSGSMHSLPSVQEADEILEKIREAEEEEYENEEESGEEMDPLRPGEPEDADLEPKLQQVEVVEIQETIVVEVVDRRKNTIESAVEKAGGRNNAM